MSDTTAKPLGSDWDHLHNKKDRVWLVWSIEHDAWWGPNYRGYKKARSSAGRYTYEEATAIVRSANQFTGDAPNEGMVLA